MALLFSIDGEPVAKGRPRASHRHGFFRLHTDRKTLAFERGVAAVARIAMDGAEPMQGALSVSLRFRLKPPKSMTKRMRLSVLSGETPYLGTRDLDNYAKATLDGMNAIVFVDDKQIVRLFAQKVADERPGVDIRVEML